MATNYTQGGFNTQGATPGYLNPTIYGGSILQPSPTKVTNTTNTSTPDWRGFGNFYKNLIPNITGFMGKTADAMAGLLTSPIRTITGAVNPGQTPQTSQTSITPQNAATSNQNTSSANTTPMNRYQQSAPTTPTGLTEQQALALQNQSSSTSQQPATSGKSTAGTLMYDVDPKSPTYGQAFQIENPDIQDSNKWSTKPPIRAGTTGIQNNAAYTQAGIPFDSSTFAGLIANAAQAQAAARNASENLDKSIIDVTKTGADLPFQTGAQSALQRTHGVEVAKLQQAASDAAALAGLAAPRQQGYVMINPQTGEVIGNPQGATSAAFAGGQITGAEQAGQASAGLNVQVTQANKQAEQFSAMLQGAGSSFNPSNSTVENTIKNIWGKFSSNPTVISLQTAFNAAVQQYAQILGIDQTSLLENYKNLTMQQFLDVLKSQAIAKQGAYSSIYQGGQGQTSQTGQSTGSNSFAQPW